MLVRSALQLERGKNILDARIQTLIVGHHYDDVSAVMQQFFTSLQCRKGITRMFQDVQHRDDVILAREVDVFDRPMMYGKAGLRRNIFADVLRQIRALDFIAAGAGHLR